MPLAENRGFSLLELLVASAMAVMVVGGMLLILSGLQDVYRDQQQLMDAQMTARLALDQMQRDIQLAGVGLLGMLSPLPVVEPRVDGGIDVRYNSGNLTARLANDVAGLTGQLEVDSVAGFEPGMQIVVYDGTGSFDLATLTAVSGNALSHDGVLSKTYRVVDGTAVKRVQTISYRLQVVDGVLGLVRQEGNDPPQPVALNMRALNVTYYDDADPPAAFVPATLVDQLRIHLIEVALVVETEDERLNSTAERTVTLSTRITPRSLMLAS